MAGKKISQMDRLVLPSRPTDLIEVVRDGDNLQTPLMSFDGAYFSQREITPDSDGEINLSDETVDLWIVNLDRSITSVILPENEVTSYARNITVLFNQGATGGYDVDGWPVMDWDRGLLPIIDTTVNGKTTIEILFITGQVPLGVS